LIELPLALARGTIEQYRLALAIKFNYLLL